MKTKLILFAFLAFIACAAYVSAGGTSSPASVSTTDTGRFQIVSGKSWFASGKTADIADVMVKIDTTTGKCWMLVMMDNTNGTTMGFAELPDIKHK